MTSIHSLEETDAGPRLPSLTALLQQTVAEGASIGFHHPVSPSAASAYWQDVFAGIGRRERVLLAAFDGDHLVGSVQLALEKRANGRHRTEVQKLMVLPEARGRGLGAALMQASEDLVRARGLTLLLLDTCEGDAAEHLYRKLRWSEAGRIPDYTHESDGSRHATIFFYRSLQPAPPLQRG